MKDSKKHYIFVQAALVSFVLGGCSSVKSTREPTVSEAVAQVITAAEIAGEDDIAKEPSLALAGSSFSHMSARSNSVWISHMTVKEPIAQGVQRHASQANDRLDIESTRQSQRSKRVTRKPEGPTVASQRRRTASVDDTLKAVLSGRNPTGESTVRDALSEVIAAPEMAGDDDTDEESSIK